MVSELIEAARSYLGVPFKHQGRNRFGVDCVGLVICAYRDIGITLPDLPVYSREPFHGELENTAEQAFMVVRNPEPGDMLLMSFGDKPISHAALYTGKSMIHSYATIGRVVEHPFRDGRPAKLRRVLRWPKQ